MLRGSVAPLAVALLAAALARAQEATDPKVRVAALADAAQREAAHRDLVALGGKAVPALIGALDSRDPIMVAEVASILREIGPDAGKAVASLKSLLEQRRVTGLEVLEALTELVPYQGEDVAPYPRWLSNAMLRLHQLGDHSEPMVLAARLQARASFAVDADVAALTRIARSHDAFRAELAIELLARRGPAAAAAVGDLAALLSLPDPRILFTSQTVPIRERAARTILALAPDAPAATTARAVLAGTLAPKTDHSPVPERASLRAEQVVAELAQPETRAAAAANLVALGPLAVPPLIAALGRPHDEPFATAAVEVLRSLGPAAVEAVPSLADMLVTRPATEAVAIAHALMAAAPWSRDVLILYRTSSRGAIAILGHPLQGALDVDLQNDIELGLFELGAAADVDPRSTSDELRVLLADRWVLKREAALRVVRARGPELRSLLPDLAKMIEEPQPQQLRVRWFAGGGVNGSNESREDFVHRLAAEAILAVAAPDDPLVKKARDVLASLPPAGR